MPETNDGFLITLKHGHCDICIAVQQEPFTNKLATDSSENNIGAEVSFVGRVRASEPSPQGNSDQLAFLLLEHYAAMTEASLTQICQQAADRWSALKIEVIHRVGKLSVGEPIVMVYVASAHRKQAFEASQFIMDYLKTNAPFWKKAIYSDGSEHWIAQKTSDITATDRWET